MKNVCLVLMLVTFSLVIGFSADIILKWIPNINDSTSYYIVETVSNSKTNKSLVAHPNSNVTLVTKPGTSYLFSVTAANRFGDLSEKNILFYTEFPEPVLQLKLNPPVVTYNQFIKFWLVSVSWAPLPTNTQVVIEVMNNKDKGITNTVRETKTTIPVPEYNGVYIFAIYATNQSGETPKRYFSFDASRPAANRMNFSPPFN